MNFPPPCSKNRPRTPVPPYTGSSLFRISFLILYNHIISNIIYILSNLNKYLYNKDRCSLNFTTAGKEQKEGGNKVSRLSFRMPHSLLRDKVSCIIPHSPYQAQPKFRNLPRARKKTDSRKSGPGKVSLRLPASAGHFNIFTEKSAPACQCRNGQTTVPALIAYYGV